MLGYDRGTYIPPFRLHEKADGLALTTEPEALELRVRGYASTSGDARVLTFQGVTRPEDVVPVSMGGSARAVLDAFQGGAEVRVYRNWPTVTDRWTEDPSLPHLYEGFSDIVVHGAATDLPYAWGGTVASRYTFEIRGLES